ncbi:MAG: hypothetical protein HYT49_03465 [Candidatus Wildermuthbacteria bacterium]|nr:hypothetical protein [Candidatus Wildermuthbacteria bacterium]
MIPEELNNPQSTYSVSQPPRSSHKKLIVLILFFCLILGGSGYAYLYFTRTDDTKTDQNIISSTSDNHNQGFGSKTLFNQEVKSKPAIDTGSVFMLGVASENSEVDWKTIFKVSSISKIAPILVVENKGKLDDFSPKLFIQQYSPKKIYTYNYQYVDQKSEKLQADNINAKLYSSSNFVVISNGEDYASSIVATSFAARFNIPIFFTPLKNEERNLIKSWSAKSIGIEVAENVDHALTVNEANDLLKKDSDYLILTTSDDLTKTSNPRFSLVAPILAGGRDGVILNVKNPTRESVKQSVSQATQNGFHPAYLVSVGNENNLPFLQFNIVPQGTLYNQDDDHQYFVNLYYWADYNNSNEYVPDASVGAITGYSVSDASSLIARSLFYEKIAKSDKVVTWSPYSSGDPVLRQNAAKIDPVLNNDFTKKYLPNLKDYNSLTDKTAVITDVKDSSVFVYSGHSWRNILGNIGVAEMPVFNNPTFIFAFGCAALEPWNPGTPEATRGNPIVGYEAIKNGAVGFLGSAEISFVASELYFGSEQRMLVQNTLTMPVGQGQFLNSRIEDAYNLYTTGKQNPEGDNFYYKSYNYLLGDPKLKLKVTSNFTPNIITDNHIRMDFESKSKLERFVAVKGGGYVLCSFDEKECSDLLKDHSKNATEFNFPILLDNYVYSADLAFETSNSFYGRTQLRFFTENPVKSITTKTDLNLTPDATYKYTGNYCFNFGTKQYCPNLLIYLPYGSVNTQTKEIKVPKYLDINFSF